MILTAKLRHNTVRSRGQLSAAVRLNRGIGYELYNQIMIGRLPVRLLCCVLHKLIWVFLTLSVVDPYAYNYMLRYIKQIVVREMHVPVALKERFFRFIEHFPVIFLGNVQ